MTPNTVMILVIIFVLLAMLLGGFLVDLTLKFTEEPDDEVRECPRCGKVYDVIPYHCDCGYWDDGY